ncbi:MAG: hypothetical protein WA830_04130 [Candidatus Sulfotelmatobacter sp.]
MRNHLAVVFCLTGTALFAQSRFDGTWEMKMDTLQFSGPPEDYLLDKGIYHCESCVPKVHVETDGTDHKVTGHPYDTLAVRILDDRSIEFTMKKDGKTTFECVETVSGDDGTMTEEFTNTSEADTVTGKAGFTRVAKGPAGSHALSGKWSMRTVKNATSAGTRTTYQSTAGGLRISDGSQSYEVKFDGKDYPVSGDLHSTVSLKVIDEYTLEETDKQDGKAITVARMTVSRDGKSMTVESSDKQRGGTMTYTAEKRP